MPLTRNGTPWVRPLLLSSSSGGRKSAPDFELHHPRSLPPSVATQGLTDLVRNIKIWYTIEVLNDLGITPNGRNGGWEIVAETVYLSPSTVEKICKPEPWEMVRKYAEFIAKGI